MNRHVMYRTGRVVLGDPADPVERAWERRGRRGRRGHRGAPADAAAGAARAGPLRAPSAPTAGGTPASRRQRRGAGRGQGAARGATSRPPRPPGPAVLRHRGRHASLRGTRPGPRHAPRAGALPPRAAPRGCPPAASAGGGGAGGGGSPASSVLTRVARQCPSTLPLLCGLGSGSEAPAPPHTHPEGRKGRSAAAPTRFGYRGLTPPGAPKALPLGTGPRDRGLRRGDPVLLPRPPPRSPGGVQVPGGARVPGLSGCCAPGAGRPLRSFWDSRRPPAAPGLWPEARAGLLPPRWPGPAAAASSRLLRCSCCWRRRSASRRMSNGSDSSSSSWWKRLATTQPKLSCIAAAAATGLPREPFMPPRPARPLGAAHASGAQRSRWRGPIAPVAAALPARRPPSPRGRPRSPRRRLAASRQPIRARGHAPCPSGHARKANQRLASVTSCDLYAPPLDSQGGAEPRGGARSSWSGRPARVAGWRPCAFFRGLDSRGHYWPLFLEVCVSAYPLNTYTA